jgi:general secretion pathway protein L
LPEAALENLQQVVGFELDRYTPFKREQVYYTAISLGKTGFGQIQVLLVLTPQVILDDLLAQLNAWGVQPARIEYASIQSAYPDTEGTYNLLPERYQPNTNPLEKSVHWLLNTVLIVLLVAVMVYPVWQEQLAVDFLKAQIKSLEKDTRQVDQQQLEIDALRDETQKLISIKTQTPQLVPVLNELTHLLKNDTWLSNLQYSEKHMQITGQSPSASSLIGLLEASPYFSKVSFVSPLTQDKVTGFERFQISMEVSYEQEPKVEPANSGAAVEQSKSLPLPENQP